MGDDQKVEINDVNGLVDRFGYAYVSSNGQLVVDRHASDEAHLLAAQTRNEQPLYDCRFYVRDFLPERWRGKWGRLEVSERVVDGEVVSVSLTFSPAAEPSPE